REPGFRYRALAFPLRQSDPIFFIIFYIARQAHGGLGESGESGECFYPHSPENGGDFETRRAVDTHETHDTHGRCFFLHAPPPFLWRGGGRPGEAPRCQCPGCGPTIFQPGLAISPNREKEKGRFCAPLLCRLAGTATGYFEAALI